MIAVAAAAAVKAGAALPPLVMLDGFQVLRGTEIALLEAVSERADVVIAIDPSAGARAEFDCERLLKRLPGADVLRARREWRNPARDGDCGQSAGP